MPLSSRRTLSGDRQRLSIGNLPVLDDGVDLVAAARGILGAGGLGQRGPDRWRAQHGQDQTRPRYGGSPQDQPASHSRPPVALDQAPTELAVGLVKIRGATA